MARNFFLLSCPKVLSKSLNNTWGLYHEKSLKNTDWDYLALTFAGPTRHPVPQNYLRPISFNIEQIFLFIIHSQKFCWGVLIVEYFYVTTKLLYKIKCLSKH